MNGGSRQDQRCPPALHAGSVPVDARSFSELIAEVEEHAQSLAFLDAAGQPAGTWGRLLAHNESFVLAAGLAIDAVAVEQHFLDDVAAARATAVSGHVDRLSAQLAGWLTAVAAVDAAQDDSLKARIERQIAPLLPVDWVENLPPNSGQTAQRTRFFALLKALRCAQQLARDQLTASLDGGSQEPAAALLLVAIQAYQRVQSRLNQFQARHTEFYYSDVLKLQRRPAIPDEIHLVFRRDPKFADDVVIAAGQLFSAAKAPARQSASFAAVDALLVTDAAVASVRMLRLDRSREIAPENLVNYVTSVESIEFDNATSPVPASGPAFRAAAGEQTARIGLAVASPILWLGQGDRLIKLLIEMEVGSLPLLLERFSAASTADDRREILGQLLMHWLFCDTMTDDDVAVIRTAWDAASSADDAAWRGRIAGDAVFDQFLPPADFGTVARPGPAVGIAARRAIVRDALVATLFTVELSTATGWFKVTTVAAITQLPECGPVVGGLGLRMAIKPDDPAIVACTPLHGDGWPRMAPVMRLTVSSDSRVFALCLLEHAKLLSIKIDVEVSGVTDLQIVNQYGPLDPSKPFELFGPIPDPASYLLVGSAEAARKSVLKFDLTLDWIGLPEAGLAAYYETYAPTRGNYADASFKLLPSLLRGGQWQPAPPESAMFDTSADGKALPQRVVRVDPAALARSWLPSEIPIVFDQKALNGLVKLEISQPRHCFGHGDYQALLIAAMRVSPRHKVPLPKPPYTPRVARITLDYAATTRLAVGTGSGHEAILHLHPFGIRTIHPVVAGHVPAVLPRFDGDNQLLIGLTAAAVEGPLTLLFDLEPETAGPVETRLEERPAPIWSWLAGDSWTPLARSQVLADTTKGFQMSGIVKLNLPPGPAKGNSILPPDLFWLRVSNDSASRSLARLIRVTAQATVARRVLEPGTAANDVPLSAGAITMRSAAVAGLLDINQPTTGFGLRPAETLLRAQTRMAERLRHRQRAATGWDYERLVLEEFPEVQKARCIANATPQLATGDGPGAALQSCPGALLVVVVPAINAAQRDIAGYLSRALCLPKNVLTRIEDFLQALCSPHAQVCVINATYEYIQVRCSVKVFASDLRGTVLTRVNAAITAYLSPWNDAGHPADFDWKLRGPDLEMRICDVPGVAAITGLSMMRVWAEDRPDRIGKFSLDDTGRPPTALCRPDAIKASRPWSLVLPFSDHIVMFNYDEGSAAGGPTGIATAEQLMPSNVIAGLEVGETMIL